jgi:signal transduction histidine kinase
VFGLGSRLRAARAEALPRLAEGLAHDIRNPLNVMAIHLALVAERMRSSAPSELRASLEKNLAVLREQVARAEDVLKSFLRFACPEPPSEGPVDLAEVVQDAVVLCAHEARRTGVRIEARLDTASVFGDPAQLSQAMIQLILRGIQAGAKGSSVRLCLEKRPGVAVLSLADLQGPGRCGCRKPIDSQSSFDLALSVAEQIVELHCGSLAISSAEGRARIEVRFPLALNGLSNFATSSLERNTDGEERQDSGGRR